MQPTARFTIKATRTPGLDGLSSVWQRLLSIGMAGWIMIKSELVRALAEKNAHLYLQDVDRMVGIVLDTITDALRDGGRVELRGFGAFSVRSRNSHQGRNPRTGESIEVPAKRAPAFKCSKHLHQRLNKKET
jgi:integration host factor subunit beta